MLGMHAIHPLTTLITWVPATLNAVWELWKPLLEDQKLQKCDLGDADSEVEFASLSDKHRDLVDLYWTWSQTIFEAKEMLLPTKLALCDVEEAFQKRSIASERGTENASGSADAVNEEEALWTALETISPPRKRKR